MKKILLIALVALVLLFAYFSKPSDKTCIIAAVEAVWGSRTPDKNKVPVYYEQFMNLNSPSVKIDDWVLFKRIRYDIGGKEYTMGYGAFNRCFMRKFKMEL